MADERRDQQRDTGQPGAAEEEPGFDQRLDELEAVVAELERGDLALEPAIERYGRGLELLKSCHRTLANYRRRVEELSAAADRALEPLAGDPDVAPQDDSKREGA